MGEIREPLRELIECGLPQALEVMGERWSFMILRASFNGLHHFEEFLSELGIARNILSNRLAKLVEHGRRLGRHHRLDRDREVIQGSAVVLESKQGRQDRVPGRCRSPFADVRCDSLGQ